MNTLLVKSARPRQPARPLEPTRPFTATGPFKPAGALAARVTFVALAVLSVACSEDSTAPGPLSSRRADTPGGDAGRLGDTRPGTADARSDTTTASEAGRSADTADAGLRSGDRLVALTITPAVATIPVGATVALHLAGRLADGSSRGMTKQATWSSAEPEVASVSAQGVVLAKKAGTATIRAEAGGRSATALITVTARTLQSLAITPSSVTLSIGAAQALSAIATMDDGSKETVTAAATWSTADPGVATLDAQGVVTAVGPGSTTVRAAVGAVQAIGQVRVTSAAITGLSVSPVDPTLIVGASVSFSAEASYDDGSVWTVTAAAAWSSSAPLVVTVNAAGVATAKAPGSATIRATYGGLTASRVVTVQQASLKSIAVTPATAAVAVGNQVQFTCKGSYENGEVVDLTTSAIWTAEPGGPAVISNAPGTRGRATGIQAGELTVRASFGGTSGTAELTVTAAKLTAIQIVGAGSFPAGVQTQLRARGTYTDGKVLEVTAKVTWESSHQGVATVANAGKKGWLVAKAPGKTTIRASLGGVSGTAKVEVTAAALLQITVDPPTKVLPAGLEQAFTARARYSDGKLVDITQSAVWSITDGTIAAVSNHAATKGLVSALRAGKVKVTATLSKVSGSAALEVTQPQLLELTIGPHNLFRKVGQYVQYWAIAVYSDKLTQNVTAQAQWSVSDSSIATLQPGAAFKGVVRADKAGQVSITVHYAGKSAGTTLTVTDPELVSVQVSPAAWETPVGVPMQFQAVALFSDDSTRNVTFQASWASTDPQVARVGDKGFGPGGGGPGGLPKGRVQAKAPGKTGITATWKGATGKAALTVTPATMQELQVFPGHQEMPAGSFRKYEATLLWSDGKSSPVTQWVSWTSSDSSVAAALNGKQQKGLVQGLKPGQAVITAAGQGLKATATITVSSAAPKNLSIVPALWSVAAGVPVKFSASVTYTDGKVQPLGGQVSYKSSDPTVATVFSSGPNAGMTQTLKAGKVTITATWHKLSATAQLTVKAATLQEIQITPPHPTVAPQSLLPMQAVAVFSDDTTQPITPMASWTSSAPKVAAISNLHQPPGKGILQALSPGMAVIRASWQGTSGSTSVRVQKAALTEIQITPFQPTLPVGMLYPFGATGIFADNSTQDLTRQASWVAADSSVATVSSVWGSKGTVMALKAGKTDIIATFGGVKGKTRLTVTGAALTSIVVLPAASSIGVAETAQLQAIGTYADGAKVPLTWHVLWKSDKPGIAPVSNAAGSKGRVTGLAQGAVTITAVEAGISGKATVVVK